MRYLLVTSDYVGGNEANDYATVAECRKRLDSHLVGLRFIYGCHWYILELPSNGETGRQVIAGFDYGRDA